MRGCGCSSGSAPCRPRSSIDWLNSSEQMASSPTTPWPCARHCSPDRLTGRPHQNDIIAVMALTIEEVDHIASLARLQLTDDEKSRFREQLSSILDHMAILRRLDTSAIEPTATVLPLRTVLRPDVVTPSLPVGELLALAPAVEAQMFRVPPVLE